MTITFLIIISIYALLIFSLLIGFEIVPKFKTEELASKKCFSILIPFRNEAENLIELLQSLSKINYPDNSYEIIMIDDESTDKSKEIIENYITKQGIKNIEIIANRRKSNSHKKDAIEIGVKTAKYDWIVTTDADCEVPTEWLNNFNTFIESQNPVMICGPVTYKTNNSFFQNYQLLDFLSLIATTIGSFGIKKPFMCNGANLCYSKKAFLEVEGYSGNNFIASGDDVFLLEKFKSKFDSKIKFIKSKDAIVRTKPVDSFKKLIDQRIRWGSKTTATKSTFAKLIAIVVLAMNLCFIATPILLLKEDIQVPLFLFVVISKFSLDVIILNKTLTFSDQIEALKFFPISFLLHPFITIYSGIGSFFSNKSSWKK